MSRFGLMWSVFTARVVLGLMSLMAGWWKVFTLTPAGHARQFFLDRFKNQWIPKPVLWGVGMSIPFIELVAGALLCLGLFRQAAYLALAAVLMTMTYGHLLLDPRFDTSTQILPRLILLVFVWVAAEHDAICLDAMARRSLRGGGRRRS